MIILLAFVQINFICGAEQNSQCFKIDQLEVQGAYNLSDLKILKLKRKYENRCLGVDDLQDLIRVVTNLYIESGYITTRAYLPEQNLNEGRLIIKVYEGLIEDVEFTSDKQQTKKGEIKNLPIKKGKVLNLKDLEQAIDTLNNHSSSKSNISLKPGTNIGSTIVVIDSSTPKKWHVNTGVDNAGTKNKGRNQVFTNLGFDNLFGLHENYNLGYRVSASDHERNFMRSYNVGFSIPYGYNNFSVVYNDALYRTFIETPKNKYSNKGGSKIVKFGLDRVIHRNSLSKTNFTGGVGVDNYSNYFAENKVEMSTYRIHKFDLGIKHQRRLEASSIGFGLQYIYGENQNYNPNLSRMTKPGKIFRKINYNLSWNKPLPLVVANRDVIYQFAMFGQYSPDMLVISEKSSLGGMSSVRGFKDYIENADNTIAMRSEIIAGLPFVKTKAAHKIFGDVNMFAAFDYGKFTNREERGKRSGYMSGIAAGVKKARGYVNFDFTIARPLKSPVKIRDKMVMYLSLSLSI